MNESIEHGGSDPGSAPGPRRESSGAEGRPLLPRVAPSPRPQDETRRAEVREICRRRFAARKLPMRFVDADFDAGGRSATIFFSSDEKVDFRELVRDLCRDLRMRVILHRIGPRDEARRTGTCGPCGRALCCKSFLAGFPPVSVKVVKAQRFPLTPDRSSGMCGRLKCCLAFETATGHSRQEGCQNCCLSSLGAGRAQGAPDAPES
ncbi:MAG TPA: regulatory iron-sulfur-containing complex subunit RicT [Candidatus Methylomirabilis sp.]